ncbi:transcriptional repressor, LexA family [Caldicellulosiruptor hydrothermalis 108]|uniref:Transcriptional repressor, LexA family n=1 Tax=Caldicellulosiruptor hydrothermalis (strain DSM 18901 / VKM B-2411 / 108) TaxID=632292 RepID=E4QBX7_CALH1|nr:MarR family transcriptional regulator [Caldicellulosiruptor hydrothermalis]ADQ06151.1 transcriptional repressor, LexA family [Caldicellulosiruptor hydrothermalis 108]
MQGLTERQQQILYAITSYINEKGYPPTVRELADMVGIKSSSTLHGHLKRLEKKGYITKEKGKPRTIVPTAV